MDRVVLNGKGYELPKKTLEIADKIDNLMKIEAKYEKGNISARECIESEYDFLLSVLGQEQVDEILKGGINDCDINDVSISVLKIIDAYNLKIVQEKIKNKAQILQNPEIKSLLNAINKIDND